jgi:hypothetical protein
VLGLLAIGLRLQHYQQRHFAQLSTHRCASEHAAGHRRAPQKGPRERRVTNEVKNDRLLA